MDLPRHVEAYKTLDSQQYFKTNDIGQILCKFLCSACYCCSGCGRRNRLESVCKLRVFPGRPYASHEGTMKQRRNHEQNAVTTLRVSQKSLRAIPKEDLSAIESIIYNDKTSEFTFQEVIEEEPPTLPSSPKNKDKNRIVSVQFVCLLRKQFLMVLCWQLCL